MQALVLEEPGKMAVRAVEVPHPAEGELLIRVHAATTCGTDLKAFLRGHPQIPMPGTLGHEYSGTVVQAGPGAKFQPGTDVMGVHSAPCMKCYWCLVGQENLCESLMATKVLGSYAEYLLIPKRIADLNVFEKPDDLSFERASLLEPLACVSEGLRVINPRIPTDRVLVIGPGAIGLMFVAALREIGIHDVTLAGRNSARLQIGEELGARTIHVSEIEAGGGAGYDVVIECTGNVEVWQSTINYVRRGGKICLFGGCPKGTHVAWDTARLHYDQITILSPFHFGTEAVRTAKNWLLSPKMNLDLLISGERALSDAPKVFEDLRTGAGIKYVFKP